MRRLVGLVALCLGLAAASAAPAQQGETRIALIIANEAYTSPNLGRLPGTQRDAALMQSALQRAGFQVAVRRDLTRAQMRNELSVFERQLGDAGARGVGFLYYSGHGIADRRRGANYLIPIDAQIESQTDLPTWGLLLNDELDAIESAGAKATFVIVDACRNTPVALGRSGERGLVATSAATRTLVAFSTQPGATAADDNVYARSLANALSVPGASSNTVFPRVQSDVAQVTGERQIPRFDSGLVQTIVFTPAMQANPGWLGLSFHRLDDDLARSIGSTSTNGVIVTTMAPSGPAVNAGLQRGDVILSIDGRELVDARDLAERVAGASAGQNIRVGLLRAGVPQTLSVRLGERPPEDPRPTAVILSDQGRQGEAVSFGLVVLPLSTADRTRNGFQGGLLITSAANQDLQRRFGVGQIIILEAGGRPVFTTADLEAAATTSRTIGRPLLLFVTLLSGDFAFMTIDATPR